MMYFKTKDNMKTIFEQIQMIERKKLLKQIPSIMNIVKMKSNLDLKHVNKFSNKTNQQNKPTKQTNKWNFKNFEKSIHHF